MLWERWFSEGTADSWTALGKRDIAVERATEYAKRSMPKRLGRVWSGSGMALKVNDKTFIFYSCRPDGVDPRGPKGK